jgi:tetratricopeptide (TPR) repeat protein
MLASADSVEAISLFTSAITKAQTAHYYRGQTNGYYNLGWFYFEQLHKRIPAIEFYNKALQLAKQHNLNKEAFGIYLNLTDTYLLVGDNISAINILVEGQRVAEKLGRDQYLPPIYSQLLECYGDIGDFRRAYTTFQEGLEMAQRAKNNHCIWLLNLGMSEVKRKEKKIQEALAYNEKAVALGYKNHEYYAVLALQNRVELLIQDNRLTEAETICNRIKKEVKVMPAFDFIGSTNASLGQINFVRKNYQKALFYTLESYQETLPTGNINNLLGLDSTLSKIYFELGEYRKSVESLRHLNLLKEQLFSEAKRNETENIQHHFELEKKQIAIENAESSKRIYLFLTFLLAITLILGIISFFIKQKNNTLSLKLLAETAKNQEQK